MEIKYVNPISDWEKDYLKLNKKYSTYRVIIHGWSTDVYIDGFPNITFNSCCFDDDFQIEMEKAINFFDDNPGAWGYGIFVKDY